MGKKFKIPTWNEESQFLQGTEDLENLTSPCSTLGICGHILEAWLPGRRHHISVGLLYLRVFLSLFGQFSNDFIPLLFRFYILVLPMRGYAEGSVACFRIFIIEHELWGCLPFFLVKIVFITGQTVVIVRTLFCSLMQYGFPSSLHYLSMLSSFYLPNCFPRQQFVCAFCAPAKSGMLCHTDDTDHIYF